MYCFKCGKQIRDGINHCPYCGANLKGLGVQPEESEQAAVDSAQQGAPGQAAQGSQQAASGQAAQGSQQGAPGQAAQGSQQAAPGQAAQGSQQAGPGRTAQGSQQAASGRAAQKPAQPKGNGGKLLPFAAVVVVLIAVIAFMVLGRRMTLKPTDYITMQVRGLNTEGSASLSFDTDRMLADITAKKTLTEREKEVAELLLSDAEKDFSMSKDSMLSNGDKVTVESSMDKNLLKSYGVVLKNDSVKLEVEGLIEVQEISLNDYVSVECSGFDGYGYAYMNVDWDGLCAAVEEKVRNVAGTAEADSFVETELDSYVYAVNGQVSPGEGVHNGDEVTLEIRTDRDEISKYGIRFVWEDQTVTVEGLIPTETVAVVDYLRCDIDGYNGAGWANLSLDTEKLASDLQARFEDDQRGAYGALGEDADIAIEAANAAEAVLYGWRDLSDSTVSPESGLSNGDTVKVECGIEEGAYLPAVGIYLEDGAMEIRVENLEEPEEVDLTDAMTVNFTGICPNVNVEITIDYDLPYVELTSLWTMDTYENIRAVNGDVFSGEIEYDEQELLSAGYRVTNSAYSYTISGLPTYALTCDALDQAQIAEISAAVEPVFLRKLMDDSDDIIASKCGSGWIVWNESRLQLAAMKTVYSEDEYDTENRMYLTYQAALPFRTLDRTAQQGDVYLVMTLRNVEEMEDGTLSYGEPDYYWDSDLYMTAEDAQAYIEEDISYMENAQVLADVSADEALTATAESEPEIHGEAVTDEAPQAGEIDAAAAAQAAVTVTYGGHTYARYDMELPWDMAATFCEKAGGHLATETSELEKAVIRRLLNDAPLEAYWLGASDADWEGSWQWITGEPFAWTDWSDRQPDDSHDYDENGENYLEIWDHGSSWNDNYKNNTGRGFILETDPVGETDGAEKADFLMDLTPAEIYNAEEQGYLQDPYGNDHYYSLALNASDRGMAVYDLNGEYSRFTGTLSTWNEADSGCLFEFAVWGDGELLFSEYSYSKGDAPIPFSLNVEGVKTLSIQSRNRGSSSGGWLFLNEAKLISSGTETGAANPSAADLGDVKIIDASRYEDRSALGITADVYGAIHRDTYSFRADSRVIWNLGGAYTSMGGLLYAGTGDYGEIEASDVEVLLDGEKVLGADNFDIGSGYLTADLDLTGKQTMEVRVTGVEEYSEAIVYLADTMLVKADSGETPQENAPRPEFPEVPEQIARRASNVVTCGNYRYYLFEQPVSWEQARNFCETAGGVLACPTDAGKTEALQELLEAGVSDSYWIGGQLDASGWVWANGAPAGEYQNWRNGGPDSEDQSEKWMGCDRDGAWDDLGSDVMLGFIMEVEAESGQLPEDGVSVTAMEWLDSGDCDVSGMISTDSENGIEMTELYPGCVEMSVSYNAWFSVSLDGDYSALYGDAGLDAGDSTNSEARLAVFGDGKLLYEARHIRETDDMCSFDVDLAGVNVLTVAVSGDGNSGDGYLYFRGILQEAGGAAGSAGVRRLSDLVAVDTTGCEVRNGLFQDVYGTGHDRYLALDAGENARVLYNLSGQYTGFSGTVTAGNDTVRGARQKLIIRVDGETVYETEDWNKDDGAVNFEIDLTGKGTLEIAAESDLGDSTWIYLTDDRLTQEAAG